MLVILLIVNNIDFIKTIGKNFVAATLGGPSSVPPVLPCDDNDNGAYWQSTSPCCALSCGCVDGGVGCSECCPVSSDGITYYCDVGDLNQCFYCTTCGGTEPRCNSQESNECDSKCDAIAECEDKPVGENISSCKAGNAFIADSCSKNCEAEEREEQICRSATFAVGCTAEEACNGLIFSSCTGNVYCDADCKSSSGLGADNGKGIDIGCEEKCDGIDTNKDNIFDTDLTRACQDLTKGVCALPGSLQHCTSVKDSGIEKWGDCDAKKTEVCWDSLDNDCDDLTDCMDPDCLGQTNKDGYTCCMDASGLQNSTCKDKFKTGECVQKRCTDDNTIGGSYVASFCGDSGYCNNNTISCDSDCPDSGCCYPSGTNGVAVCMNETSILNIDDEAKYEICCGGDWKGANCKDLTCTSEDNVNHDCCASTECSTATIIPGDCGSIVCDPKNYCTVNQSISKCSLVIGTCGVTAGNCTAQIDGSYSCSYIGDDTQCNDNDDYCKCIGTSCDCDDVDFCDANCEYLYGECITSAGEPKNKESCAKHGCWSNCTG